MAFKKQFESLYQSVANDLQKLQASVEKDFKNTSAQLNALNEAVQTAGNNEEIMREFHYTQKQIQSLYVGVENVMEEQVVSKIATNDDKLAALDEIKAAIAELTELKYNYQQLQAAYESLVANTPVHTEAFDYERLADMVAERMAAKEHSYDVVIDEAGIDAIAEKVAQKLGIEEETSYDLVLDEEGIDAIAKGVANELRSQCTCAPAEEAPAEEPCVCEPVEEPVEEVVEEVPAAEPVAEEPAPVEVKEEMAVAQDPILILPDLDENNLVDAETGLVIRLKKSFTAKLKQSEDDVKSYYSQIKNELTSYKRINSNVSWHGDRFNFGRDTVAKINICGKTLCLYLALDPEDPEFKTTVYHQKNVGGQKAYESTPFMVKVKSDAAAKKAVRLAVALAEKLAAEKEENFVEVDYVAEYAYETTKKLYEDGFIKATKEKKVDLNF
ncbi:MAG: hypothetical protein IJ308_05410 [Clostridia bacterium]|nr:hypothetical protein [Clostridia bacterium]